MARSESKQIALTRLENELEDSFGFTPTTSQKRLFRALARFILSPKPSCVLIVKGYAGTGKTSVMNSLVKNLDQMGIESVLLAPTGRAAKVLSYHAGKSAYTIHRRIYFRNRGRFGGFYFTLGSNRLKRAVFIVDEASMIGRDSMGSGSDLLNDLFEYVFSSRGCKLVLVGDGAQLPPVGQILSPALNIEVLDTEFDITSAQLSLDEVMRQSQESNILDLATKIRGNIGSAHMLPIQVIPGGDVEMINGTELQDCLESAYSELGPEGVVLISRSNRRCNAFNQEVRNRIFFREGEISTGDFIMAVKNNYAWLDAKSKVGFIANGDIMEVLRIGKEVDRYGFSFRHVTVRMIDYPNEEPVELVIWIDALMEDGASMSDSAVDHLRQEVLKDYGDLDSKEERRIAVQKDPYYNAVQVKFAYALTCHKSQGGQWPVVFVDQGYLKEEMLDDQYFRWLYTAVTRATERLFLLNFNSSILEFDS